MRENIGIFRGKDTIEHKWRYGNLTVHGDTAQIWVNTEQGLVNYLVDPETVGEFTGVTDKNGAGIFEGDILRSYLGTKECTLIVRFGTFKPDFFYECAQEFGYNLTKKIYGLYVLEIYDNEEMMLAADMKLSCIIGNIHDNPELIGGGNEENGYQE